MNKPALKKFATGARRELINKITIKAEQLGITKQGIKDENVASSDAVFIDGRQLTIEEQSQRKKLTDEIKSKGYNQVVEEVAYTWFNRFIALRFMEVNNYLPTKVRVLSSKDEGSYEPDIIKEALNINLDIDKELVYKLRTSNENDAIDRLYKYLVIKQCNALNHILPPMFEKISDPTELLFPEGLLSEGSFLRVMTDTNLIPEDNWESVEVIGWLYQYYISERKDEVFAGLRKNKKIQKEDIAPATQLFTPHWIVRYMVENSVGKLWQEGHPDEDLKQKWKYYIETAEQEKDVQKELNRLKEESKKIRVENIKIIDPAMGSGHILVYAFDLLYDIYLSEGYVAHTIPKLIIEKNLYGIDIDKRAFQLAYFALMMKGRSKSRRFFNENIETNICAIEESNEFPREAIEYFVGSGSLEMEKQMVENDLEYLTDVFHNAKEYGSILKVKEINFKLIEKRLEEIKNEAPEDIFKSQCRDRILDIIPNLVKQCKIMSSKYNVMVTNPPYMGSRGMNAKLSEFLRREYPDTKADLFAVFMELDEHLVKPNGYMAMINQHSWMFLSSFEKYRVRLSETRTIDTMLHLGPRAFEEIGGEVVQSTAFVNRKIRLGKYKGTYIRLIDYNNAELKEKKILEAAKNSNVDYRYNAYTDNFNKIPGDPIAYWVSDNIVKIFLQYPSLREKSINISEGIKTGLNKKYIRHWFEVNINEFYPVNKNRDSAKWVSHHKGGEYRRWYGNKFKAIFWENDGYEIRSRKNSGIQGENMYFGSFLSWSKTSGSKFGIRYYEDQLFDSASPALKPKNNMLYVLGFLSSKAGYFFTRFINPTLSLQVGNVGIIPIIEEKGEIKHTDGIVQRNILISQTDWDSFETSWDFQKHPILTYKEDAKTLKGAFNNWSEFTHRQFNQLKGNEEELNRIFIEIYGLQDELIPEVEDKDITISKVVEEKSEEDKKNPYTVDRKEAVESFISYAIGCMFGRYSLDGEGLAYAGGEFDTAKYRTFPADRDNVIPILSNTYFENDIVDRFEEFVKITFGEDALNENLKYIADTLGVRTNETPKDTIRRYFLNDFYKHHVQIYKKRPIYWLFTSGRRKAFNALIYMHRYNCTTLAKIRTDYLHVLQSRLDTERQTLLKNLKDEGITNKEKRTYEKYLDNLEKDMEELKKYDEKLHNMADRMIEIDLDDGVKNNYKIFEGLLQKI